MKKSQKFVRRCEPERIFAWSVCVPLAALSFNVARTLAQRWIYQYNTPTLVETIAQFGRHQAVARNPTRARTTRTCVRTNSTTEGRKRHHSPAPTETKQGNNNNNNNNNNNGHNNHNNHNMAQQPSMGATTAPSPIQLVIFSKQQQQQQQRQQLRSALVLSGLVF